MELIDWSYTRHYNIKARFEPFIHSDVIFRQIKDYYFVYTVRWSDIDPVVERGHLEEMEILMNRELGMEHSYFKRMAFTDRDRSEYHDCSS
ncbi:MAG TPA: hypothetical protein DEO65_15230 [Bacillus bacterium]|uniref:Uncharacterized protein n=1 Tax=Siminovitchia fordii TaxID=254759 RepID=A0ABQ4K505_9BACI|nr:hypothetical protein [Siminovitchia fordii]GIN20799.1 hypothetical protein J1TS3_19330 [Siminovitchia fordii]HBZ11195.1 hypothetical protein [Bacillus sp. (in: firmicutes)]